MRYEEYKPIDAKWEASIPSHWDYVPLRHIFIERKEINVTSSCTDILSLTNTHGVIPYSQKGNMGNKQKDDLSSYHIAHVGDLVVNSMNVIIGSSGVSKYHGCVSPVYYTLTIRNDDNVDYYGYFFKIPPFFQSLKPLGNGILEIRLRIPMNKLNTVMLPVPPREEQDQIVRYLDWKVSCINKLIHGYQRQIKLLEERYTSMVTEAVVHGIDEDVHLVDVNIQGFDRIPDTWKVVQNKRIFRERSDVSKTGNETLLSVSKRFGVKPYNKLEEREKLATIKPADSLVGYKKVAVGNLAMNIMRARNGSYGISDYEGIVSPAYCVYELVMPADSRYIHYLLKTPQVISLFEAYSYGICEHRRRLYAPDFLRLYLPIPPVEEQKEIADYIAVEEKRKHNLIKQLEKQISLLKEYRTRLISDVVTGQMDVRGVVVPDYTPEDDAVENEADEEMTDEEVSMDAD